MDIGLKAAGFGECAPMEGHPVNDYCVMCILVMVVRWQYSTIKIIRQRCLCGGNIKKMMGLFCYAECRRLGLLLELI